MPKNKLSNKVVAHYNPPSFENKEKKPKQGKLHKYQMIHDDWDDAHSHVLSPMYMYKLLPSKWKSLKEVGDGKVIYLAKNPPSKQTLHFGDQESMLIEGSEFIITEKTVSTSNNFASYLDFSSFSSASFMFRHVQKPLDERVKEFLERPKERPQSPLILPESYTKAREAEANIEAITEFIQSEVRELQRHNDMKIETMAAQARTSSRIVATLETERAYLIAKCDYLEAEVSNHQRLRTSINENALQLKECGRYFRDE